MKKKSINLKKKLVLKKETLTTLTPFQQAMLAGGLAIRETFTTNCETAPITGRPFCILCP
ncbi:class I lanthipeptide [Chitinophaga solisilvae]|uniref:class I lanthipeptide n=1 Tax=Chitinophaga solisilvae TaxID=1233460 RepID=UPI00136ED5DD|nr:class I lanthipeptide [Chitinophaga solisilvae]